MTLEIQEIGIRMRVAEDAGQGSRTERSGRAPRDGSCGDDAGERARRDSLVEDCVRRVLDVLKMREER